MSTLHVLSAYHQIDQMIRVWPLLAVAIESIFGMKKDGMSITLVYKWASISVGKPPLIMVFQPGLRIRSDDQGAALAGHGKSVLI
jgi:hypothetical protein